MHTSGRGAAPILEWRQQRRTFDDVAAYQPVNRDLGDVGDPERLRGARVTPNLFDVGRDAGRSRIPAG